LWFSCLSLCTGHKNYNIMQSYISWHQPPFLCTYGLVQFNFLMFICDSILSFRLWKVCFQTCKSSSVSIIVETKDKIAYILLQHKSNILSELYAVYLNVLEGGDEYCGNNASDNMWDQSKSQEDMYKQCSP
jgi:hypothetical protein